MAQLVKNPLVNAGDVKNVGSNAGWRRSPEGGDGNPLKYSCMENPMDSGAWRATVHWVTKSQTQLKQLSIHAWQFHYLCQTDQLNDWPLVT